MLGCADVGSLEQLQPFSHDRQAFFLVDDNRHHLTVVCLGESNRIVVGRMKALADQVRLACMTQGGLVLTALLGDGGACGCIERCAFAFLDAAQGQKLGGTFQMHFGRIDAVFPQPHEGEIGLVFRLVGEQLFVANRCVAAIAAFVLFFGHCFGHAADRFSGHCYDRHVHHVLARIRPG